jgi:hypothetical protein
MFLIAVGDRVAKIAWFSDADRIDWHTSNIAKLSGSMLPKHDPQIEAVCADGLGRDRITTFFTATRNVRFWH